MKRTFFVAGVQFRPRHEIDSASKLMNIGDQLGLVPEPENKFDPNAIKIEFNTETADGVKSVFLGYVPKKYSSEVAALLDVDLDLECVVEEVNPQGKTYEMIKVTIQEKTTFEKEGPDEGDRPDFDEGDREEQR